MAHGRDQRTDRPRDYSLSLSEEIGRIAGAIMRSSLVNCIDVSCFCLDLWASIIFAAAAAAAAGGGGGDADDNDDDVNDGVEVWLRCRCVLPVWQGGSEGGRGSREVCAVYPTSVFQRGEEGDRQIVACALLQLLSVLNLLLTHAYIHTYRPTDKFI